MLRMIASGAFVEQELAAEFGRIPPAFLPIGLSRLYEEQISFFGAGAPIHLTVPEGFTPQAFDQRRLQELNVILVPVPEGLRLGESIVYAINFVAAPSGPMQLLHGDTLIANISANDLDLIAIRSNGDDYSWAAVQLAGDAVTGLDVIAPATAHREHRPVACGYFAFRSSAELVQAITRARGDFIGGLNLYTARRTLRAVCVEGWLDFGHIQTYFRSRRTITTGRSFNTLHIDAATVRKVSHDREKLRAEAFWLRNIPPVLQRFSVRLLEDGEEAGISFYRTEYHYSPTLAELLVFSSIGRATWRNILRSCAEFLNTCADVHGCGSGDAALAELTVAKTVARLERFARETAFDIERATTLDGRSLPSLLRIAQEMGEAVDFQSGRHDVVMHGDFCFSNILYNSRAGRITVIDPRGFVFANQPTIFGDSRYDLAKLSHSVVGRYDDIMAGRYGLTRDSSGYGFMIAFDTSTYHKWLQAAVADLQLDGLNVTSTDVRAVTVGLFLSMLPLHSDRPDRQTAFIANALRLYANFVDSNC